MVQQEDPTSQECLRTAFSALIPATPTTTLTRRDKGKFSKIFENFAVNVYGICRWWTFYRLVSFRHFLRLRLCKKVPFHSNWSEYPMPFMISIGKCITESIGIKKECLALRTFQIRAWVFFSRWQTGLVSYCTTVNCSNQRRDWSPSFYLWPVTFVLL